MLLLVVGGEEGVAMSALQDSDWLRSDGIEGGMGRAWVYIHPHS